MSRAMIIINSKGDRDKASRWAYGVPAGTRIEFKETKRTLPQNDRFWAMLTDISVQMKKQGRDHTPEQWKVIFMAAYGHEVKFLPTLDQKSFIPLGHSSSDLSVKEMTDLIEFMLAWGAENGVQFNDQKEQYSGDMTSQASPDAVDRESSTSDAADEGAGDVSLPQSAPSYNSTWLETAARMLWAATNAKGNVEANLELLNNQRLAVAELDGTKDADKNTKEKAGSIYRRCKDVVMHELEAEDAVKIIAGLAGTTEAVIMGKEEVNG